MTKHTVVMLKDVIGHDDNGGVTDPVATHFKKGETYNIGESLLHTLINDGAVELAQVEAQEPVAQEREIKIEEGFETLEAEEKPAKRGRKGK